jgi:hypothetical protein
VSLTPIGPHACSEPTCLNGVHARGLCASHYGVAYRRGELPQDWPSRPATQGESRHALSDVDAERLAGTCSLCGPVEVVAKRRQSGASEYRCRVAIRANRAKRRERHKLEGRPKNLSMYGITWPEYQNLLRRQGDACAICRMKFSRQPCVDHDHMTGVVRGLLCRRCNSAISWLDDSPRKTMAAYRYLKRSAGLLF